MTHATIGTLQPEPANAFKSLVCAAFAIGACWAMPAAAGEPISVTARPQPTLAEWTDKVAQDLDRGLRSVYHAPIIRTRLPYGFVAVSFQLDGEGRASDIAVSRKSGSHALNSIGKQVVARLRSAYPLPEGVSANQLYEAHIIVAPDPVAHDKMLAEARAHSTRMASASNGKVVTFALAK